MSGGYLSSRLSKKTFIFGFKLWVVLGIGVGVFIVAILFLLAMWLVSRKKRSTDDKFRLQHIPSVSKEIKEVKSFNPHPFSGVLLDKGPEKIVVHVDAVEGPLHSRGGKFRGTEDLKDANNHARGGGRFKENQSLIGPPTLDDKGLSYSPANFQRLGGQSPGFDKAPGSTEECVSSPGVAEVSHLGWGHWYTLRELDAATGNFADFNVLGEGGYGIVYRGKLPDGTPIAVKKLLNNRGQAEKEFRVEVEAIGRVRHKNLVRLLGYCVEGNHRMLVYEYVDNGNLDQWLHGPISRTKSLTWDSRMKILLGSAKALAYLHEALEPKVVHRDIKSSNILVDASYSAKISDFGLAKLLGAGKSHVTTRVMGTFGYVAPEYANTGLLNERSDVYSFGVLIMEVITGRDPVDYSRPPSEVNLVDWLKTMVGQRRSEEVADPNLEPKPASRALKRALLVALRCVDPDSSKRPKMGHVVHMLEADEYPYREDRRVSNNRAGVTGGGKQNQHQQAQEAEKSSSSKKRSSRSRYEG